MYHLAGLIAADLPSGAVTLYGSQCPACGRKYFPLKELCADCLETLEKVEVGPYGRIFSYTTVAADSPAYKAPYTLAFVDLDDGVRLLARIQDGGNQSVGVGKRVKSVRTVLATSNGEELESFAFQLLEEDGQ